MKPGDTVQIKQRDQAIQRHGEELSPIVLWVYATVLELTAIGALVQVDHPGNILHALPINVARSDIRTTEDVQDLHDAHPAKDAQKLDFNRVDHKELNNLRAALDRMKSAEDAA
jgi:hypothetical protein